QFFGTFEPGDAAICGNTSIRFYASDCESNSSETHNRVPPSSIANPSKRRKKGAKGYDAGKKVKGRRRHLLVDTNGFVLKVRVHPADVPDSEGGKVLLNGLKQEFARLVHLWADGGYFHTFVEWVQMELGWTVEVVKRPHKIQGEYARLVHDFIG